MATLGKAAGAGLGVQVDRETVALHAGAFGMNADARMHADGKTTTLEATLGAGRHAMTARLDHEGASVETLRDGERTAGLRLRPVDRGAGRNAGFSGEYLGADEQHVYQLADDSSDVLLHDRAVFANAHLPEVGARMHVAYRPNDDRVDVRELPAREKDELERGQGGRDPMGDPG